MKKSYCTQPGTDCLECSLSNYGHDCRNNPAAIIGLAAFTTEMCRAKTMQDTEPHKSTYWIGYQRGLRRAFHGEKFGHLIEHEAWLRFLKSEDPTFREGGEGYRDGLLAGGSSDTVAG